MLFRIIREGDGSPALMKEPSRVAERLRLLMTDELVEIDDWTEHDGWLHVNFVPSEQSDERIPGWIERRFVGEPLELKPVPADKRVLARQCARVEMATRVDASPDSPAVLADYILAVGLIETGLERVEPQVPDSDAVGPWQIDSDAWAEFIKANGFFQASDRFLPSPQSICVAYQTQRDWVAFSKAAASPHATEADGPVVPTYLNLFHCRLIGVPAAVAVRDHLEAGKADRPMSELLAEAAPDEAAAATGRHARFLKPGGADATVGEFDAATGAELADAMAKAADLLREHFADFVAPPGDASWMRFAREEQEAWSQGWTESADPGRERVVKEYFRATSHHPDKPDPWCGAFVAWCVKQAGLEPVNGAARAANWTGWGEVEIRDRTNIPPGAVVVFGKTPDSGGSGHVSFFVEAEGGRLKCLGGNQGNRVKISSYPADRVVAVRWPETPPAAPAGGGNAGGATVAGAGAGGDDEEVLTLARTLWGEARGEGPEGIQAVAAVIVNRKNSGRYPDTFAKVCQQNAQFSCWNANDPNRAKMLGLPGDAGGTMWPVCLEVARAAVAGTLADPTQGALHYHAKSIMPAWVRNSPNAKVTLRRGNHIFYTGIK